MTETNEMALTPITQAQRMLAEASTLPDLKALRDYATGAKAWAQARKLGIGAENEATEVILRTERNIGAMLSQAESMGLYGEGAVQRGSRRDGHRGAVVERQEGVITNADLGIRAQDGINFRRLAGIPDEQFEAMIHAARSVENGRLAKTNFYTAIDKAERRRTGADDARPTPLDPDFEAFRRGAFGLLGWEVNDDGSGTATKNGLTALPNDELMQMAALIKALAVAFNEARTARA